MGIKRQYRFLLLFSEFNVFALITGFLVFYKVISRRWEKFFIERGLVRIWSQSGAPLCYKRHDEKGRSSVVQAFLTAYCLKGTDWLASWWQISHMRLPLYRRREEEPGGGGDGEKGEGRGITWEMERRGGHGVNVFLELEKVIVLKNFRLVHIFLCWFRYWSLDHTWSWLKFILRIIYC